MFGVNRAHTAPQGVCIFASGARLRGARLIFRTPPPLHMLGRGRDAAPRVSKSGACASVPRMHTPGHTTEWEPSNGIASASLGLAAVAPICRYLPVSSASTTSGSGREDALDRVAEAAPVADFCVPCPMRRRSALTRSTDRRCGRNRTRRSPHRRAPSPDRAGPAPPPLPHGCPGDAGIPRTRAGSRHCSDATTPG
jgi:hypothetical protein